MKQKDVLTKNNDLLNVMFRGTPCNIDCLRKQTYFGMEWDLEEQNSRNIYLLTKLSNFKDKFL